MNILEFGSIFSIKVYEKDNHVYFKNFPISRFLHDVSYYLKNEKLVNIFQYGEKTFFGSRDLKLHKFFIPEILFIIDKLPSKSDYEYIKKQIIENTWIKRVFENTPNFSINKEILKKELNFNLKDYQLDFIDNYLENKYRYMLRGYLLAFEQGLGKTVTSISLMKSLNKDSVIIIAPKNTIFNVWTNEINNMFKTNKTIWTLGKKAGNYDYYIINYEMMDSLSTIYNYIKNKNVGVIIDECHNFRNEKTKRVINLKKLISNIHCDDILMMSGTPIKALGTEMIPMLYILDPLFDDDAVNIFKKISNLNTIGLEILHNRIKLMMTRRLKSEVLKLPNKIHTEIKIKFPGSNKYVLENVKNLVRDFITERTKFYKSNMKKYESEFEDCVDFLDSILKNDDEYNSWKKYINYLRKYGYSFDDKFIKDNIEKFNKYEKDIIYRLLPDKLKIKFKNSRTVIKYVNLKIMGEVIGGYLNKLRSELYQQLIEHSPTCKIINNSKKKTLIYTTFIDVLKAMEKHLRTECKQLPLTVYGETKNIPSVLSDFKNGVSNPLIATVQSLSTGVTLVEANTVIFVNPPWRSTDKEQAEDRVHRIGQDEDVYIYNYVLDTGNEPNLSTRMNDILDWSKSVFSSIVGESESSKIIDHYKNNGK